MRTHFTKFTIKEPIWFMMNNKAVIHEITRVNINVEERHNREKTIKTSIDYYTCLSVNVGIPESQCYATKEELLQSL
jgi:hypothetical protein